MRGYADMWYNIGIIDYNEWLEANVYEDKNWCVDMLWVRLTVWA